MARIINQAKEAADLLNSGELVFFQTETVWGISASPSSATGIERLLDLKERELTAGIPLIACSVSQILPLVTGFSGQSEELANKFWPGPLTLVLNSSAFAVQAFYEGVFGPEQSLALRVSSLNSARALAEALCLPITAISANPKGMTPATSYEEVINYFPFANIFLPAGKNEDISPSAPSTILDARVQPFKVLRAGAINPEALT